MSERSQRFAVLGTIAMIVMLACGYAFCFVTVGKGEVGVMSWFGDVQDGTLDSGPHLVHPLKKVYRMNTQTQKNEEPASVPTKNGLQVSMKATMLYHIDRQSAPRLAREVGDVGYEERVIDPIFKAAVRDACAEFPAEALYTQDREKVESRVFAQCTKELGARGVTVEQVMLLEPQMPQVVKDRIEAKVGAEQDVERMQFVLKTRKLEADAKVIEAQGIADAQKIVKKDLDHNYLVYLWIEALKESAKHNNATIYIPTGGDGMPLFRDVKPK